jgi:hypothetical protein
MVNWLRFISALLLMVSLSLAAIPLAILITVAGWSLEVVSDFYWENADWKR